MVSAGTPRQYAGRPLAFTVLVFLLNVGNYSHKKNYLGLPVLAYLFTYNVLIIILIAYYYHYYYYHYHYRYDWLLCLFLIFI